MVHLRGSVGWVSDSWPQLRSWCESCEFKPHVGSCAWVWSLLKTHTHTHTHTQPQAGEGRTFWKSFPPPLLVIVSLDSSWTVEELEFDTEVLGAPNCSTQWRETMQCLAHSRHSQSGDLMWCSVLMFPVAPPSFVQCLSWICLLTPLALWGMTQTQCGWLLHSLCKRGMHIHTLLSPLKYKWGLPAQQETYSFL